jgi:hypothetical protein
MILEAEDEDDLPTPLPEPFRSFVILKMVSDWMSAQYR